MILLLKFHENIHDLSQTGPVVLHNLSFHIKSGQRVGVGTSSLHCSRIIDANLAELSRQDGQRQSIVFDSRTVLAIYYWFYRAH